MPKDKKITNTKNACLLAFPNTTIKSPPPPPSFKLGQKTTVGVTNFSTTMVPDALSVGKVSSAVGINHRISKNTNLQAQLGSTRLQSFSGGGGAGGVDLSARLNHNHTKNFSSHIGGSYSNGIGGFGGGHSFGGGFSWKF